MEELLGWFAGGVNVLLPDYNKFIAGAVALDASFIISGGGHLWDLANYMHIQTVHPNTSLALR